MFIVSGFQASFYIFFLLSESLEQVNELISGK